MDVPPATVGAGAGDGSPPAPIVLVVAADETRRNLAAAHLLAEGEAGVLCCSDTEEAMKLLLDGRVEFRKVWIDSMNLNGAAVLELFEYVVGEMHLEAYAISPVHRGIYGPFNMKDLDEFRAITSPTVTATSSTITTDSCSVKEATGEKIRDGETETAIKELNEVCKPKKELQQKPKKTKLVWTPKLDSKFVDAYNKLSPTGDAKPKKILELMKEVYPTLTRENIASHLQKYKDRKGGHVCKRKRKFRIKHNRSHQGATPSQAILPTTNMFQQLQAITLDTKMQNMSLQGSSMVLSACFEQITVPSVAYMPPAESYGFTTLMVMEAQAASGMEQNIPELHVQSFQSTNLNLALAESAIENNIPELHVQSFESTNVNLALAPSAIENKIPELHMQSFESTNINLVATVHPSDKLMERSLPKKMHTGCEMKSEFDIESCSISPGDISKSVDEIVASDPGSSWDCEFI